MPGSTSTRSRQLRSCDAEKVVGAHRGNGGDAGGHHLEGRRTQTDAFEVVSLDIRGGDVGRYLVLVDLARADDGVVDAEQACPFEETVVVHGTYDDEARSGCTASTAGIASTNVSRLRIGMT